MKNLVIGLGEVGKAIQAVLQCDGIDIKDANSTFYEVLHICFPYSDSFIASVREYQEFYKAKLVVIHSTVPVGTTEQLDAVHSPIRGVHPHLELSIRTFVKYFGGPDAFMAAESFARVGIKVKIVESSRTTEALKLWDTTQHGAAILLEKEIHEYCRQQGIDFDTVYRDANETYNQGYAALGWPQYCRPFLKHIPGPIGGHCVIPNAKLLASPVAEDILRKNTQLSE